MVKTEVCGLWQVGSLDHCDSLHKKLTGCFLLKIMSEWKKSVLFLFIKPPNLCFWSVNAISRSNIVNVRHHGWMIRNGSFWGDGIMLDFPDNTLTQIFLISLQNIKSFYNYFNKDIIIIIMNSMTEIWELILSVSQLKTGIWREWRGI